MLNERLSKQIQFILEIDKLKHIFRQNIVTGTTRNENDAEHSWHLAIMAMMLYEYSRVPVDVLQVIKMVVIHDLVEIYAGDTYCYDKKGYEDKAEREERAAEKLFGMLPGDQSEEIWNLWREFEELKTSEAKFAACLDRVQPLILNYNTNGHTWRRPGVTSEMVLKRNELLKENAPEIWEYAKEIIEDSIKKGYLKR
ncbi:HD family hydrolase [Clostridium sp. BSD9I1]|uniref:HD domain-containing protein n=1 Tax=Clostridium sp. BSD9I1 TaxID=2003589 RepID=UPI0016474716|nr:HD domain-containing protein [Clostridium sp. BSD9I1]